MRSAPASGAQSAGRSAGAAGKVPAPRRQASRCLYEVVFWRYSSSGVEALQFSGGLLEGGGAAPEVFPGVFEFLQAVEDGADGNGVWAEILLAQFAPIERHGNRRAGARTDRVNGNRGLRVGVAIDIDEHASAALVLVLLEGVAGRIAVDDDRGKLAGER